MQRAGNGCSGGQDRTGQDGQVGRNRTLGQAGAGYDDEQDESV
jgi:hypothetical protein